MKLKYWLVVSSMLFVGCMATFQKYESVTEGPKAKLNFSSPNLKGGFLSDVDLDLRIFEVSEACKKTVKGRLELEPDAKTTSTYIPAEEYVFVSLSYFKNSLLGGAVSGEKKFGFIPKNGAEYTIVFGDGTLSYSVALYEGTPEQKISEVTAVDWNACK